MCTVHVLLCTDLHVWMPACYSLLQQLHAACLPKQFRAGVVGIASKPGKRKIAATTVWFLFELRAEVRGKQFKPRRLPWSARV